jgi:hypothetical protein
MEVGSFIPKGESVNSPSGCEKFDVTAATTPTTSPWMMNVVLDKIIQDPPGRLAIF